jgi:hypothetical protein
MASPFPTPPTSPRLTSTAPLPPPPRNDLPAKEISQINRAVSQYYWPRHFEHAASCAPALFIDRIMTDYADHQDDPVGAWIVDMSPIYKVYKVCLKYGTENGSPAKAAEAKTFQGVFQVLCLTLIEITLPREPGVQDVRSKHSGLRAAKGQFTTRPVDLTFLVPPSPPPAPAQTTPPADPPEELEVPLPSPSRSSSIRFAIQNEPSASAGTKHPILISFVNCQKPKVLWNQMRI